MNRIVTLLLASEAAIGTGCGPPPQQHPLTLVLPITDCSQESPPPRLCPGYLVCYDLGINLIQIVVGPFHPETTRLLCQVPQSAPTLTYEVYYQPGQENYAVEATYTRNGSPVAISSGPFSEDESQTPWTLSIQ